MISLFCPEKESRIPNIDEVISRSAISKKPLSSRFFELNELSSVIYLGEQAILSSKFEDAKGFFSRSAGQQFLKTSEGR
tara:strand:+ start:40601 stop:40837 length:237 start_codon:yes stop_codon:yes gene_type:complete